MMKKRNIGQEILEGIDSIRKGKGKKKGSRSPFPLYLKLA